MSLQSESSPPTLSADRLSTDRLSTEEAASRLGVKRETIYAYVSRGILSRQKAVDGKASTFNANEVDRLRRTRMGGHPGRLEAPVSTSVAEVRDGSVSYRGRLISELAAEGTTYEQAAHLLWDIPQIGPWTASAPVIDAVAAAMTALPDTATLIDRMLAGVVMAATHDPFRDDKSRAGVTESMKALVAAVTEALPIRGQAGSNNANRGDSIAARLWPRLTTESPLNVHTLDRALMLLADHGMATSTMAARMAASTRAGPHAAVVAGLGALTGPLHGAASRSVHNLLDDAAQRGAQAAIADVMRTNGRIPGIGHFIHKTNDPRFGLMMEAIDASSLDRERIDHVHEFLEITAGRIAAANNIDFTLGSLTYVAKMPPDAGELIFALARIAGWVAHTLEEYEEAPLRFRPVGRYASARPRPAPT